MRVINKFSKPVELKSADGDSVTILPGTRESNIADKFNWQLDPAKIKVLVEPTESHTGQVEFQAKPSVPNSVSPGEVAATRASRETMRGNGPSVAKSSGTLKGFS
jgi:hypothetical protein